MIDRLTKPTIGCFAYDLKDHKHEIGDFGTYDAFFDYHMAVKRLGEYEDAKEKMPEIVCLCGSTRFYKTFDEQNFRLTLEGKIVLSIGCNTKSDEGLHLTAEDKVRLDELHKRKIDLCDAVFVLNVGGYIGDSTRSEIEYAEAHAKPVYYLETPSIREIIPQLNPYAK